MPVIKEIILISNKEIANKESLGLHKSINIITTDDKSFAKVLFETTGSEPHINSLGELEGNFQSEEEIYRVKGFHFIAPEMREAEYDISSFSKDKPAWDLVEENDIKGVVHSHTTYSDGANTPEELACFCRDNGYEYLCISDHSKSAYYAGGLKEDDILRQRDEIAALNEKLMPFKIFAGIESDILKDGSLDYSDETLKSFDFVIASVHSVFNLPKDDMTKRIVNAANNPYTTILGHPTGRLLLGRESYLLDMEQIADACIKSGTVIEINANPHRLDMDWKEIIKSREKGGLFSINPDAHSLNGIFHIRFGVSIARKGGLRASNVINTKSASEIGAFFRGQKGK
jgi:DNA polymerase (family 10)